MNLLLTQLGCLAALAASAWAAGWLAWGRRRPEMLLHPFPVCLGLALLGQAGLVLAAAGQLRPTALLVLLAALHGAAARGWRLALAALWRLAAAAPRRALGWTAAALLAAAPGLLIGLYPPHAFDETTYHLPFVRAIAATGSLPYLPELRTPVFPQLAETLQTFALLAGGDSAAHVVSLLATLLAAGLLLAWGREAHGREAGWLAAGLFLGSPLVAYLAGTGYVEPLLALLSTAALYAVLRPARPEAGWAAAAGALAGSAAAVKYLGLLAVAVAAVPLLRGEGRARRLLAFLLAAAPCAIPTYAWIGAQTGNPLHPFYPGLFGATPWMPEPQEATIGQRAAALVRLPADAVWRREAVGGQPPLSPAFLLGLPLLVWAALRRPSLRRPLALLALALASFLVVPGDARYLLPWLPLWSLALGAAAAAAWEARVGRPDTPAATGAALLALGLMLPGALYGPFYAARVGAVPTSEAARRLFLARQVPGYGALAWLAASRREPSVVYALHAERLHGIAPQELLGEHTGPWDHDHVAPLLADPPRLASRLRSFGATHLLLLPADAARLPPDTAPWLRRVYVEGEASLWELTSPAPRASRARAAPW